MKKVKALWDAMEEQILTVCAREIEDTTECSNGRELYCSIKKSKNHEQEVEEVGLRYK